MGIPGIEAVLYSDAREASFPHLTGLGSRSPNTWLQCILGLWLGKVLFEDWAKRGLWDVPGMNLTRLGSCGQSPRPSRLPCLLLGASEGAMPSVWPKGSGSSSALACAGPVFIPWAASSALGLLDVEAANIAEPRWKGALGSHLLPRDELLNNSRGLWTWWCSSKGGGFSETWRHLLFHTNLNLKHSPPHLFIS